MGFFSNLFRRSYTERRQHELVSKYANIDKLKGEIANDFVKAIDEDQLLQSKLNKIQLPALLDELSTLDAELEFISNDIEDMQRGEIQQKKYIQLLKQRTAVKKQKAAVMQEIAVIEEFENNIKNIEKKS